MKKNSRILETIPSLLLAICFAACTLSTVLAGAKIYRNVSAVMEAQYSVHTCVNYVMAKARHYDYQYGIEMGKLGETDAILFYETYEGIEYVTYLYHHDGYLMELYCAKGMDFAPKDGEKILPMDEMTLTLNQSYLAVSCQTGAEEASFILALQSKKGGEEV